MKKILVTIMAMLCATAMFAQEQAADSASVEKPKYWKTSLLTQLGFSQVSLIDWAAGGFGSVSLNSYVDFNAKGLSSHKFARDKRLAIRRERRKQGIGRALCGGACDSFGFYLCWHEYALGRTFHVAS